MSSRPSEYPRASAALAGLGLTTQLAVAATDGIPIVKQVLAVASRIITLVEDIEKRRDALHGLADTARSMAQSIEAVVSDREVGTQMARRLEALHTVLRSIETLLETHKAKTPLRKALSYAFTTAKRIDSLNQDLSRAVQEFLMVAAADTNAQVREDPRYIGEFRRIHHGDVEDLELIMEQKICQTGYSSQIYSAKVGGSVCILRCFGRNSEAVADISCYWEEWHRRQVTEHDQLLQKLSRVQTLHRNVARLYGRSSGDDFDRFNVMNLGCIPISEAPQLTATVDGTWNIVRQILDALCHLNEQGATWKPDIFTSVFVDGTGAPIIGVNNDLGSFADWVYLGQIWVLGELVALGLKATWQTSSTCANRHRTGGKTVTTPFSKMRRLIPLRAIPSMNEKISRYLQKALASCEDEETVWVDTGAVALRAAASGGTVGSAFWTTYWAGPCGQDRLIMCRVEERGDEVMHLLTHVKVPVDRKDQFRKKLGITLPASDTRVFISNCDPAEPSSMSFRRHC